MQHAESENLPDSVVIPFHPASPGFTTVNTQTPIDGLIARYDSTIQDLDSRRNTCPVLRLPPETLTMIFFLVRDDIWQDLWLGMDLWSQRHWLYPSHVCRRWRDVALNCPLLWNHIDLCKPQAAEMLQRSKMAPLCIRQHSTLTHPWQSALWNDVMSRVSRIKKIVVLGVDCVEYLDKLALNMDSPALDLQALIVTSRAVFESQKLFLERKMPALVELYLSNVVLGPHSLQDLSPNLTSLELSFDDESYPTISIRHILGALANAPNLKKLALVKAISALTAEEASSLNPVHLSKLEDLEFDALSFDSFGILPFLRYPPTTFVRVECVTLFAPTDTGTDGIQDICSRFTADGAPIIHSLRLCSGDIEELLDVRALGNDDLDNDNLDDDAPRLLGICGFRGDSDDSDMAAYAAFTLFYEICKTLPLASVRNLSLEINHLPTDWRDFSWKEILDPLIGVERAQIHVVSDGDPDTILDFLEAVGEQGCLPILRMLEIENSTIDSSTLPAFVQLIKSREDSGRGLNTLFLIRCEIERSTVKALKEVVHTIAFPDSEDRKAWNEEWKDMPNFCW